MSTREKQNLLRDQAADWLLNEAQALDWYELAQWQEYFERMGRKYGLLKEFKESGVC